MNRAVKVVGVLTLLGAATVGLVAYNAGSIVRSMKPQLEAVASEAAGGTVTLGNLDLSLFPSARITVDRAELAARPDEKISLENITLKVRLLPLLRKRVEIVELSLSKPVVTLLKDESGTRLAGVPQQGKNQGATEATPPPATDSTSTTIDLSLERFQLTDARFELDDRTTGSKSVLATISVGAALVLNNDEVRLNDLSLQGSVSPLPGTSLPLAVSIPTLHLHTSRLELDLPKLVLELLGSVLHISSKVQLAALTGELSISSPGIDLTTLASQPLIGDAAKGLGLSGSILPNFSAKLSPGTPPGLPDPIVNGSIQLSKVGVTLPQLSVAALNGTVELQASLAQQTVQLKEISGTLNGEPVSLSSKIEGNPSTIVADPLSLSLAGGSLSGTAEATLGPVIRAKSEGTITSLNLGRLLKLGTGSEAALTGTLEQATFKLNTSLDDPLKSATGSVRFKLKDATLAGTNIVTEVLKAVKGIPFLAGTLYEAVPENEKQSKNTEISAASGSFVIGNGGMQTSDLLVTAPLFSLSASGRINFNTEVTLKAAITFTEGFSQTIVTRVSGADRLLDDKKRLTIPLQIQGKPGNLLILPDIAKLIELGTKGALKGELGKLLGGGKEKGGKQGLGGLLGF